MRIEMLVAKQKDSGYLTSLHNNEPGIYIGNNYNIWIVNRKGNIAGYFSSTMNDFYSLDESWKDYNFASEKIVRYTGDLVLRNVT